MANELLSILVPCIPERWKGFYKWEGKFKVYPCLTPKHPIGPTIGEKRDWLVQMAKGEYLCFIDDDDSIRPDGLFQIVDALKQNPDVVTFQAQFRDTIINMDLNNKVNEQYEPNLRMIQRPPWHVCVFRTEIAQRYHFPFKNYGEDWPWCEQVIKDCKTQVHIDEVLYYYNWDEKTTAAKLG